MNWLQAGFLKNSGVSKFHGFFNDFGSIDFQIDGIARHFSARMARYDVRLNENEQLLAARPFVG